MPPLGMLGSDSTVPTEKPTKKPTRATPAAPASPGAAAPTVVPPKIKKAAAAVPVTFDSLFGGNDYTVPEIQQIGEDVDVSALSAKEESYPRTAGSVEAQALATAAEAGRAERAAEIGANIKGLDKLSVKPLAKRVPGTPGLYAPSVKAMSQEKYDKLSDTEKAAVDFNTQLGKAVRRDTQQQEKYDPTDEEKATYDATVKKIFGEDGGSEHYAPETLALLRQVMYEDTNADLDDFLGMNMAVTAGALSTVDVPSLEVEKLLNPFSESRGSEASIARDLALKTNDMEDAIVKGTELMHSVYAMSKAQRQEAVDALGGLKREPVERLGYQEGTDSPDAPMEAQVDAYFVKAFDKLSQKETESQRDEILKTIRRDLAGAEKAAGITDLFGRFVDYADNRSRIALDYGQMLGELTKEDGTAVEYQTPEDFRRLLGLNDRKVK